MREITSLKNPEVQRARTLQTAKGRAAEQAFLLDGEHMVNEALNACPQKVRTLFVDAARLVQYGPLLALAEGRGRLGNGATPSGNGERHNASVAGPEVFAVPVGVLEAISQVKTPQGVAAICALPAPTPLAALRGQLVMLENVQDPGNVGTVLRTLDAAGFGGCILTPGCADPYAPKTLRATMGSVFRVPVAAANSAAEAATDLKSRGYAILGAELHGQPFYQRGPLPENVCVLIGNEGAGLTQAALNACTHRYKLPMKGGAESLNAAVAAAVMMYDLVNR